MPNFSGVAQTNFLASPIINSPPSNSHGRVRICYDTIVTLGTEVEDDTITFGGQEIPKDARILFSQLTTDGVGATAATVTLAIGSADPITTAVNITAAGVDYSDTHGEVLTAAAFPVLTIAGATGALTISKFINLVVLYVID